MQTDEKQINIYECIPASLINKKERAIYFTLSNTTDFYNQISFEMYADGSFIYRDNRKMNITVNDPKPKDEVLKKILIALSTYNKKIKALEKQDNNFLIDFFPLEYLKVNSLELIKSDDNSFFWSCYFKIEVPAYKVIEKTDNKDSIKTITCNLANAYLQIDINGKDKIIGMQYYMLPFRKYKTSHLLPILTKDGKIPQIVYLLDRTTAEITPFYISSGDNPYVPASKESKLSFTQTETIRKSILLFDNTNRITERELSNLANIVKKSIEKVFRNNDFKIDISVRWGAKHEKSSNDIFFEVGSEEDSFRSWAEQGGSNGYFKKSDISSNSNIPAHEFAHIMGLSDRYHYLIECQNRIVESNGTNVPMYNIPDDIEYKPITNLMSSENGNILTSYQKNIMLRNIKEKDYHSKVFFVNKTFLDAESIDIENNRFILRFKEKKPQPNMILDWIEPLPLKPEPDGKNIISNIKCDNKDGEKILNFKKNNYLNQHTIWSIIHK